MLKQSTGLAQYVKPQISLYEVTENVLTASTESTDTDNMGLDKELLAPEFV